jgi:LmbE family N-acetylglucosaminyl deacetylase
MVPMKEKKINILVIVAHPDDEAIGLGGTIARHANEGCNIFALAMTNGVGARECVTENQITIRKNASKNAANLIGFTWLDGPNYPDNAMDTIPMLEVVRTIENAKSNINPAIIYTHSYADLNIDHRITNAATLTAFRPQPTETWAEIRTFEVPSATDYGMNMTSNAFLPNLFINIEQTWNVKLAALREYATEIRESPHARSLNGIENLAKLRGNQCGVNFAEAFEVIRKIVR